MPSLTRFWKYAVQEFIDEGETLDAESGTDEYDRESLTFATFDQMVKFVEDEGINVVEWIEGHVPENMLDAKFIQQLPTWRQRYPLDNSVESPSGSFLSFLSALPGSLFFTLEDFLFNVAAAEAELSAQPFDGPAWPTLKSMMAELAYKQVDLRAYVAGHGPQGGSATMLGEMLASVDENGVFKSLYAAALEIAVHLNMPPPAVLAAYLHELNHEDPSTIFDSLPTVDPSHVNHEDAVAFVNALPAVDISTIPREDMRCPHCWADFDEDVSGYSNEPKLVLCCGKWFGKDCLVESLEGTGPLCPLCRQDMFELAT